jgi:hypothetical protein
VGGAAGPNNNGTFPVSGTGVSGGTTTTIDGNLCVVVAIDGTHFYTGIGMNPGQVAGSQPTLSGGPYLPAAGDVWTATKQVEAGDPPEVAGAWHAETGILKGWINFGVAMNDAALESFADRLHASSPAGMKWDGEYGNECWNTGPAGFYIGVQAGILQLAEPYQFYVKQADHCRNVFAARWATHPGRSASDIKLILGTCAGDSSYTGRIGLYATTNVPPIAFDYFANAPYYNNRPFDGIGPSVETTLVPAYNDLTRGQCLTLAESNARWGKYGVNGVALQRAALAPYPSLASIPWVNYEFAISVLVPPGTTYRDQCRSIEASLDPEAYWLLRYLYQVFSDQGVVRTCYFGFADMGSNEGGITWDTLFGYNMRPGRANDVTRLNRLDEVNSPFAQAVADWNAGTGGGGGRGRGRWLGDAGFLGE